MAGVVARSGEWQALYPIPLPRSVENPGSYRASALRPEFARLAIRAGVDLNTNRFMQPPPAALLLYPLGYFTLHGGYYFWIGLLLLATWGMSRQASQLYTLCNGNVVARTAGVVTVVICVSPEAHRWIRVGNMSALIGWLLGFAMLRLLRRDNVSSGLAIAIAAIAKYVSLAWLPWLIVTRQWRAVAWSVGIIAAAVVVSVGIMGWSPFHIFASEIAPTLNRCTLHVANSSLRAFFLRVTHTEDTRLLPTGYQGLFSLLEFGTLGVILLTMIVRRKQLKQEPYKFIAAAIALMGWTLIFSPILWEHYQAYLAVFWGWLAAESNRSPGRRGVAGAIMLLLYIPTQAMRFASQIPEPIASHLLWGTVLWTAVATIAIWRKGDRESFVR